MLPVSFSFLLLLDDGVVIATSWIGGCIVHIQTSVSVEAYSFGNPATHSLQSSELYSFPINCSVLFFFLLLVQHLSQMLDWYE
jgi:hypothetical protein